MHQLLILLILASVVVIGCTKKEGSEPGQAVEPPAEAAASEATGTDKPTGEEQAAEALKAQAADAAAAEFTGDKAKLARAYIDIYCAQRKGETELLLDIYTKAGFEDPKTWTEQWTAATTDKAWVARVTQEAIRACP